MRPRPPLLQGLAGIGCALAMAVLLGVAPLAAHADQTDPRLHALFDILKTTEDPVKAKLAEHQIWQAWLTSDDPTVTLLMMQGVNAMAKQDLKSALRVFTQLVEIAPDFAEGWNKRATVLYLLGAYPESIADIDRTLALEPRHFGALSGLGLCNVELQKDQAALDAFERALAVNPHMDGARSNAELLRQKIEGNQI